MKELRFDVLQQINGGSDLSYELGKFFGKTWKNLPRPSYANKKPYKTSLGTLWL